MTNSLFKLCADDVYLTFPKINDEILINEVVRRMINLMVSDLISTSKENIHKFARKVNSTFRLKRRR